MPIEVREIPELAARIRNFGWHLEFLFPGKDIVELMPVLQAVKVPISIAHFAYQRATEGVASRGFKALIELMRRGSTWMKISGANRVSATDLPPYDDVAPMAHGSSRRPERIVGHRLPHPTVVNPNDGDLVDAFGDWFPTKRCGARSGESPPRSIDSQAACRSDRLVWTPFCDPSFRIGDLSVSCHISESIAICSGWSWTVSAQKPCSREAWLCTAQPGADK